MITAICLPLSSSRWGSETKSKLTASGLPVLLFKPTSTHSCHSFLLVCCLPQENMDFSSLPKSKELECSFASFAKVFAMVKCGCYQSWWCFKRWKSNENEAILGWVQKKRCGQRFTAVPSLLLVLCSAWGSMCCEFEGHLLILASMFWLFWLCESIATAAPMVYSECLPRPLDPLRNSLINR